MCTGNICRSPMAEAMLRQRLAARALDVFVHSAGLVLDGQPAHPHAVETLEKAGLDLSGHTSRIIDAELARSADLIIAMELRHVREVAVLEPSAFNHAFTLPELVIRAREVGPRVDVDFDAWIAQLGAGRKRIDVLKKNRGLEVPDPMGKSRKAFLKTFDEIGPLLDEFVDLAWPDTATNPDAPESDASPLTNRSN